MKWDEMRESDNVEDERGGSSRSNLSAGGMLGGLGAGGAVIAVIAGLIFNVDPAQILNFLNNGQKNAPASQGVVKAPVNDRDSAFVKSILGDTEDTWGKIFKQQLNTNYQAPKLVLFDGSVSSACGSADTAAGPFYCPADKKVYLDMGFFKYLEATAGNDADFARSYAIPRSRSSYPKFTWYIRKSKAVTI